MNSFILILIPVLLIAIVIAIIVKANKNKPEPEGAEQTMDVRSMVDEPIRAKQSEPEQDGRDNSLAIICFVIGFVFLCVTVWLVLNSSVELDSKSSQILGTGYVLNFQNTIYAVGSGIISAIFMVGGFVLTALSNRS